jgi:hypothetical protein
MRASRALGVWLIVSLTMVTLASCSGAAEETLLTQFFAASRLRDLTALGKLSTVVFEPASDGIVTSFDVLGITGDSVSKEVSISAPVRLPDGRTMVKRFAITIQGGLVTKVSERPVLSPVEGPASPSTPRP